MSELDLSIDYECVVEDALHRGDVSSADLLAGYMLLISLDGIAVTVDSIEDLADVKLEQPAVCLVKLPHLRDDVNLLGIAAELRLCAYVVEYVALQLELCNDAALAALELDAQRYWCQLSLEKQFCWMRGAEVIQEDVTTLRLGHYSMGDLEDAVQQLAELVAEGIGFNDDEEDCTMTTELMQEVAHLANHVTQLSISGRLGPNVVVDTLEDLAARATIAANHRIDNPWWYWDDCNLQLTILDPETHKPLDPPERCRHYTGDLWLHEDPCAGIRWVLTEWVQMQTTEED